MDHAERDPRGAGRRVEIRVVGTVGAVVADHLAEFRAVPAGSTTVLRGPLSSGEDLATVLSVLNRHGVRVLDSRVVPSAAPRTTG